MARSRSVLPAVIIGVLVLALTGMLALGFRYVIGERRGAAAPEPIEPPEPDYSRYTVKRARRVVGPQGILALAIKRYQVRPGGLPASLDDLIHRPADLPPDKVWDGPYIHTKSLLSDPWGRPYRYQTPGIHHPDEYDLWSTGPDGKDGTTDDVGNWS